MSLGRKGQRKFSGWVWVEDTCKGRLKKMKFVCGPKDGCGKSPRDERVCGVVCLIGI